MRWRCHPPPLVWNWQSQFASMVGNTVAFESSMQKNTFARGFHANPLAVPWIWMNPLPDPDPAEENWQFWNTL